MTLVLKWSHGHVVLDRAGGLLSANKVGRGQGQNFYIGKNCSSWLRTSTQTAADKILSLSENEQCMRPKRA